MSRSVTKNEEPRATVADDEFGDKVSYWFEENSKLVNALLLLVILGVLAWTGYRWYRQSSVNKASAAYAAVLEQFNNSVTQEDAAKKQDALNGAVTAAQNVINKYPNHFVGRQAQLLLGNAYYKLAALQAGDQGLDTMKKSQAAYQEVVNDAKTPEEKAAGYIALGNVLQDQMFITEKKEMAKQVEDAYKQASDTLPGTYLDAEAKMNLARLYEGTNRVPDARKLYENIALERKVAPSKETADEKPIEVEGGQVLTPEQILALKSFKRLSYEEAATQAQQRLAASASEPAPRQ